jgi:pimeloyl-ACP methyl ester carboxylesterase
MWHALTQRQAAAILTREDQPAARIRDNGCSPPVRSGGDGAVPLVLLQHFRGNLDNWDPALIDALAASRRVVTFDNAGVGGSAGTTPDTIGQMARDAIAFIAAMQFSHADLLGFSIGSFIAQQIALVRPGIVGKLVLASSAPQGAAGMHGWAPEVTGAIGTPETGPTPTLTCSSPGQPPAGEQAPKRCSARMPGPAAGTRPRPGRHARRSTTPSAPGGSPTTRGCSG